jgi:hypothetical protein
MKKAQIAGQIFIYVIAMVVVGLIVAYGYSAIKGFSQRGEEVEYITLKTDIENSARAIISDYGSIKRPDINIPGKYKMVCFVDKKRKEGADDTYLCREADEVEDSPELRKFHQPIACAGWKNGRDNVFLIPDGSESFDMGEIVIVHTADEEVPHDHPFLCIDVVNNKINLQLTGKGDRVEVSVY